MIEQWTEFLNQYLPEAWMRALAILASGVMVGWIARLVLTRVVARVARRSGTPLDDQIIAILQRPIFLTAVLMGVFYGTRALGVTVETELTVLHLTQTVAALIWTGAAFRMCRPLLDSFARLADRVQWIQARTVPLFDNFGRVALFVLLIYLLLSIWDLDVAPWLASAGIVGIALGFAAKDSLANLFGGLLIIVDSPYQLGDYINLDTGERGEVTKIGLRSTRLLTRDDVEITVPNAQIAMAKIINEAGGRWEKSRIRVKVGVAYGSDVAQVKEVLMAAATAVEYALDDPEPCVRFRELGDSSLNFELLVWIEKPELRGLCTDNLLTEVYNGLRDAEITIPFPQRELHIAAPVRVQSVAVE